MNQQPVFSRAQAFALFEEMFKEAQKEIHRFTREIPLSIKYKADKTVVTACDNAIDALVSRIAVGHGLLVVSEEGEQSQETVENGTYCTIDPIDGTREYIESVNDALLDGGIEECFLQSTRSKNHNFCFLVGLVENGIPTYGACYDYVTGEQFFIDANSPHLVRSSVPMFSEKATRSPVVYTDSRVCTDAQYKEHLREICSRVSGIKVVVQGSFGLNALHALLNNSPDALVFHPVQQAGLWDVLPAAVAARAFGGEIFDGQGQPLRLDFSVMVPGPGLHVLKGDKFRFVIDELRSYISVS